jgi:hypothetical protein
VGGLNVPVSASPAAAPQATVGNSSSDSNDVLYATFLPALGIAAYLDGLAPGWLGAIAAITGMALTALMMVAQKRKKERTPRAKPAAPPVLSDKEGYSNQRELYLAHLTGNLPEALQHLRRSLKWPMDMRKQGWLWHFHKSKYQLSGLDPRPHRGIDILAPYDEGKTKVKAIFGGKVIQVYVESERVYSVYIRSENGLICVYGHLSAKLTKGGEYAPSWKVGQNFKAGDVIGTLAWSPRALYQYKDIDDYPAFLLPPSTLATHLHLTTWHVPPELSDREALDYIHKPDSFGFNPLLILQPLYRLPPGYLFAGRATALEDAYAAEDRLINELIAFIKGMEKSSPGQTYGFLQAMEEVYGWEGIDCSWGVSLFALLLHNRLKELGWDVPVASEGERRIEFINIEVRSYSAVVWPHYVIVLYWDNHPFLYIDPTFSRFFGYGPTREYRLLCAPIAAITREEIGHIIGGQGAEVEVLKVNSGSSWHMPGLTTEKVEAMVRADRQISLASRLLSLKWFDHALYRDFIVENGYFFRVESKEDHAWGRFLVFLQEHGVELDGNGEQALRRAFLDLLAKASLMQNNWADEEYFQSCDYAAAQVVHFLGEGTGQRFPLYAVHSGRLPLNTQDFTYHMYAAIQLAGKWFIVELATRRMTGKKGSSGNGEALGAIIFPWEEVEQHPDIFWIYHGSENLGLPEFLGGLPGIVSYSYFREEILRKGLLPRLEGQERRFLAP